MFIRIKNKFTEMNSHVWYKYLSYRGKMFEVVEHSDIQYMVLHPPREAIEYITNTGNSLFNLYIDKEDCEIVPNFIILMKKALRRKNENISNRKNSN